MKKLLVALCFACAIAVAAHAEDKPAGAKHEGKKASLTPEQKTARKELKEKYDANKDGKLDKDELAKATAEEREKAGYPVKKEKAAK